MRKRQKIEREENKMCGIERIFLGKGIMCLGRVREEEIIQV